MPSADFVIRYVLDKCQSETLATRRDLYRGLSQMPDLDAGVRNSFLSAAEHIEAAEAVHHDVTAHFAHQSELSLAYGKAPAATQPRRTTR